MSVMDGSFRDTGWLDLSPSLFNKLDICLWACLSTVLVKFYSSFSEGSVIMGVSTWPEPICSLNCERAFRGKVEEGSTMVGDEFTSACDSVTMSRRPSVLTFNLLVACKYLRLLTTASLCWICCWLGESMTPSIVFGVVRALIFRLCCMERISMIVGSFYWMSWSAHSCSASLTLTWAFLSFSRSWLKSTASLITDLVMLECTLWEVEIGSIKWE